MDIPHFVYPFISNRHLGHFFFLVFMKNAAMNEHSRKTFCVNTFSILLGIYLGKELLSHVLTLYFPFGETASVPK